MGTSLSAPFPHPPPGTSRRSGPILHPPFIDLPGWLQEKGGRCSVGLLLWVSDNCLRSALDDAQRGEQRGSDLKSSEAELRVCTGAERSITASDP